MTARPAFSSGRASGRLADRCPALALLLLLLLAGAALVASPSAQADEIAGFEVGAGSLPPELPLPATTFVSGMVACDADASAATPPHDGAERSDAAHPSATAAVTAVYDDPGQPARTSASRVSGFLAPQTGDDCGSSVVIGESTTRTREAAAAFGATIWIGPRAGASHLEKCAANETWIRSEIQRGTHIIDIGIDSSRQETRSPYYALELRELAAANYPVERQPWGPSLNQYVDEDYGGPCP